MRLAVIDGNSLLFRAFYALPPMTAPDGRPTNAVYGFLSMLFKLLDEYTPDALVVAFDMNVPTFRHVQYDAYKAGRRETPDELIAQFGLIRETLDALGIARMETPGYEADDILGSLASQAESLGVETLLITGDRDALQLIRPNTRVLLTKKGITEIADMTVDALREMWGIAPARVPDLKGLMGDTSDNIPGVPGVGEKTAVKLLAEYGTLDNVLLSAGSIKGKLGEKIAANREQAELSRWLATIDCSAPVRLDMDEHKTPNLKDGRAVRPFSALNFRSLLTRLGGALSAVSGATAQGSWSEKSIDKGAVVFGASAAPVDPPSDRLAAADPVATIAPDSASGTAGDGISWKAERVCESVEELLEALQPLRDAAALAIHATDALTVAAPDGTRIRAQIRGDLATPGLEESDVFGALESILHSGQSQVFFDAKWWMSRLSSDTCLSGQLWDAKVAAFLIEPATAGKDLGELCGAQFGESTQDAQALWMLYRWQEARMRRGELLTLYETIERPLTKVLSEMEKIGFLVDAPRLREIGLNLDAQANALRNEVWSLAGTEFNLNSPKQLQQVLYERLGIEPGRKTKGKTGLSTGADVLEPLAEHFPVVAKLLEYRHVAKLKGTYIDGLIQAADAQGRVHSTLHQTGAVTGRISSSEPNLQNIPIRTQQGRIIRSAFVARPGWLLIDADYSQIELRVLAHMSQDEALTEAFRLEQDIHTRTASEVFGVPMDAVTSEMRSSAKAVNFGIVYGISGFGLAKGISASRAEAQAYIDAYFARYPGVKRYMTEQVRLGEDRGYVETLFGRRRYLPELQSRNRTQRSFGERAAMNTPIQGTAADIIKLAMVRVSDALARRAGQARLILQVHDELIVEAPESEAEKVAALVRDEMMRVAELSVPLEADVGIGPTWLDAK